MRSRVFTYTCIAAGLAIGASLVSNAAVLNPDMKPGAGTYKAPMGKLGENVTAPWSATTVEAAPEHKPLPGKLVTRVGEIIDMSCYLQVGKHGDKHRDCGQKCLRNGAPIGLLTKDGTVYLLVEEEHHPRRDGQTNFRDAAIEHMGHVMQVSGTLSHAGGESAIFVHGYVKQ